MNNIKFKSFSLKKKQNNSKSSNTNMVESQNYLLSDRRFENEGKIIKQSKPVLDNLPNNLIDQIQNMIKSPSSNFSSKEKEFKKTKGKGIKLLFYYYSVDIKTFSLNFFEKQLKNRINSYSGTKFENDNLSDLNSNKNNHNENVESSDLNKNLKNKIDNEDESCLDLNSRINIKLNINSEVINNNIKINHKSIDDCTNLTRDKFEGNKDYSNYENIVN